MDPVNTRPKGMSIAIGNNAKIDLGTRTEEALLSFGYGKERGKDDDRFGYTIAGNTEAKENLPEGIAIGTNSFARDRKSTRLNSSHSRKSRMPSSA